MDSLHDNLLHSDFRIISFFALHFLSKMIKAGLKEYLLHSVIQSQQTQNEALNQGLLRIQESLRDNLRESDRQMKDSLERSQANLSGQSR